MYNLPFVFVSDLSEYWAEDFKVSGHLFARTSDKDLYGATLPPSVTYDVTATKAKNSLEKTETVKYGDLTQASSTYPYNYGQANKKQAERDKKQTADIAYSDYKSYGQIPQVYKPLEHQQNEEFSYNSFKPNFGIGTNYDGGDVYRNIKDVLGTVTSEKSIGTASEETPEDNRVYATNKATSKVRLLRGNGLQSRTKCRAGICRKKAKNTNRVYPRPTKRIKKVVYNY